MKIDAIDAFSDNIIWVFRGPRGGACVVDPGDATPVLAFLAARATWLEAVLITHHHQDHVGGLEQLQLAAPRQPGEDALAPVTVWGPEACIPYGVNSPVKDGDRLVVGPAGEHAEVLAVPGHTQDHLAFWIEGSTEQAPVLFCGDTLFAGGCGRLLDGTAEQMHRSLGRLSALPPETQVYCAHEYTLSNLRFAAHAFPESQAIALRLKTVEAQRQADERTLPSSIGTERQTNPFLLAPDLESFRSLRLAKDSFRPPAPPPIPN